MSLTVSRNQLYSARQTQSEINKLSNAELAKLARKDESARNLLVIKNKDVIEQAAKYVVIERNLNEHPEEFESIAVIKLLRPDTWEANISDVRNYIFRVSKNAIIDELRKEFRQGRFLSQFNETSSLNKAKTLEEYVTDPMANDLNRNSGMLELEEELLRSIPLVYKTGENPDLVQQIIELSLGIDLGTNPSHNQLKGKEIADNLNIPLTTLKNIKFRFNQEVRNRLVSQAA